MEADEAVRILPVAQRVLTTLFEKECENAGMPVTSGHCIADLMLPEGVRIEPGEIPCIRVSIEWFIHLAHAKRSEEIVRALRRAVILLPRFTRTLSNTATRAAIYIEAARSYRYTHPDEFTLPPRHFKTHFAITLTCPLTGEVESVHGLTQSNLMEELEHARHRLSVRVYQHDQVADLLDTIEAARMAREVPPDPDIVTISTAPNEVRLAMEYNDEDRS